MKITIGNIYAFIDLVNTISTLMNLISGFQSVVLDQQHQHHSSEHLLKMQIIRPTSDSVNQTLYR